MSKSLLCCDCSGSKDSIYHQKLRYTC